jgi:hypothetical protein
MEFKKVFEANTMWEKMESDGRSLKERKKMVVSNQFLSPFAPGA